MTVEFFTEKVLCEFPSCGCDYPDTQCRTFEYHLIFNGDLLDNPASRDDMLNRI